MQERDVVGRHRLSDHRQTVADQLRDGVVEESRFERRGLREGPIELLELILESEDRLEAVITFVAVLELLRRSSINVRQKERFGPIHIEARH